MGFSLFLFYQHCYGSGSMLSAVAAVGSCGAFALNVFLFEGKPSTLFKVATYARYVALVLLFFATSNGEEDPNVGGEGADN